MKIRYKGYTAIQTSNLHVLIFDDNKNMVLRNTDVAKRLCAKGLRTQINKYIKGGGVDVETVCKI